MQARIILSLFVLLTAFGLYAQQVQKCCGTGNSAFMWGLGSISRHTQSLYLPGDLVGAQDGMITRLYFRYGETSVQTPSDYTNVMIRLGLTSATIFQKGNTFFTALDTVLMVPQFTIDAGNPGEWFAFDIEPFAYTTGSTLILDTWFEELSPDGTGTYGGTNFGRKLYTDDLTSPTGITTSVIWQDFGFDVDGATGIASITPEKLRVVPLPGYTQWQLMLPSGSLQGATVQVLDAAGRIRYIEGSITDVGPHLLDLNSFSAGLYIVHVQARDGSRHSARLVKP